MIAKDESLFVVMDALNQVCRRHRTEKLLSNSHDVTGRVAASFSNTEGFGYISLLRCFNDDAIVFGHFHDNSSMSNTSLLGRSFPYISMICWYESLPSGTLVITVGINPTRPGGDLVGPRLTFVVYIPRTKIVEAFRLNDFS